MSTFDVESDAFDCGAGGGAESLAAGFAEESPRNVAKVLAALEAVSATAGAPGLNSAEVVGVPEVVAKGLDAGFGGGNDGDEAGGVKAKGLDVLEGVPKPLNELNFDSGGVAGV